MRNINMSFGFKTVENSLKNSTRSFKEPPRFKEDEKVEEQLCNGLNIGKLKNFISKLETQF